MKKIIAMLLALIMVFALVACGNQPAAPAEPAAPADPAAPGAPAEPAAPAEPSYEDMGTILWLSNLSGGAQYDATCAYMEAICDALGYEFQVAFGDPFNDAANNLLAVQNAMTDDVVGMVTSQDGGLKDIMEAYPELWVAGYNCDMRSVYDPAGANAACAGNDHYLGTIADGYGDGFFLGKQMANLVIEAGYEKVAIINFPVFAYPNLTEADAGLRAAIDEYNATAEKKIEIVGDTTTLMFEPLPDSWFLEAGRNDLDAIIGLCAGVQFVYPTMVGAMANGTCAADTKLLTSGFETDPDIIADIGGDGVIAGLTVSAAENPAYGLILIDNAITGNIAEGTNNACVDSAEYVIDSVEDINNVMTKTLMGTGKAEDAHLNVEEILALCGRNDSSVTWQQIVDTFQAISVDELK